MRLGEETLARCMEVIDGRLLPVPSAKLLSLPPEFAMTVTSAGLVSKLPECTEKLSCL